MNIDKLIEAGAPHLDAGLAYKVTVSRDDYDYNNYISVSIIKTPWLGMIPRNRPLANWRMTLYTAKQADEVTDIQAIAYVCSRAYSKYTDRLLKEDLRTNAKSLSGTYK